MVMLSTQVAHQDHSIIGMRIIIGQRPHQGLAHSITLQSSYAFFFPSQINST